MNEVIAAADRFPIGRRGAGGGRSQAASAMEDRGRSLTAVRFISDGHQEPRRSHGTSEAPAVSFCRSSAPPSPPADQAAINPAVEERLAGKQAEGCKY